jgi:thiosulfate reductase cytochrome b subunit
MNESTTSPSGIEREVRLFSRFEILWHWSQATLIIGLLITGFVLHGTLEVTSYRLAARLHVAFALALILVWIFAIFWHIVTGEWRQYVPTTRKLWAIVDFYTRGIFAGEPHPFRPTRARKHNPLQLVAYLAFNAIVSPTIWVTGLLYLAVVLFGEEVPLSLEVIAPLHVAMAYATAVFLVAHVYMITTGETVLQHLKAMLTGYETRRVDVSALEAQIPERALGAREGPSPDPREDG